MGDRSQAGKPSRHVTSHPGQLSLAIPSWVGAVSTTESWDVNRHTARCTSPVSVVWQCKLVSGWGLRKRISAPPYGSYGSGRTLRFHEVSGETSTLLRSVCWCWWPRRPSCDRLPDLTWISHRVCSLFMRTTDWTELICVNVLLYDGTRVLTGLPRYIWLRLTTSN